MILSDKPPIHTQLEFFIEADGFRIFANLSETIQGGFGIRYVGEVTAFYENDVTRKGVMKIEIDIDQK